MNNDYNLNLHSGTKLSGRLGYQYQGKLNTMISQDVPACSG